jgi:riboflavin kinase/FMN adenylyltransferase
MNIGLNPTTDANNQKQKIEVHLFDFNEDIYEKPITVSFLKRIRDEQKFESVAALKNQLSLDKLNAISYIEKTLS